MATSLLGVTAAATAAAAAAAVDDTPDVGLDPDEAGLMDDAEERGLGRCWLW